MNSYFVTFRWKGTETFCTNLCMAESEEDVQRCYAEDAIVRPAHDYEIVEAKRRGMPVITIYKDDRVI